MQGLPTAGGPWSGKAVTVACGESHRAAWTTSRMTWRRSALQVLAQIVHAADTDTLHEPAQAPGARHGWDPQAQQQDDLGIYKQVRGAGNER
jgi:hypothetical protein